MDGFSEQIPTREVNLYVVSDGQIIKLPTINDGKVESESSISVPLVLNHHH
jgi:hypothetical protein